MPRGPFRFIARRGEGVFTPGQMAALGRGGPVTVNITNAPPGTKAEATTSASPVGVRALISRCDGISTIRVLRL